MVLLIMLLVLHNHVLLCQGRGQFRYQDQGRVQLRVTQVRRRAGLVVLLAEEQPQDEGQR